MIHSWSLVVRKFCRYVFFIARVGDEPFSDDIIWVNGANVLVDTVAVDSGGTAAAFEVKNLFWLEDAYIEV